MKYGFVLEAAETLKKLVDTPMPRIRRLELRRVIKQVDGVLEAFTEERNSLIEEFGGEVSQEHERWGEFIEQYNELLNVESEVELTPLSPSLLDEVEMSVREEQILEVVGLVEPFDETE